ncbi:MAG TPA: hypothetical protein VF766_16525 [Pyrinomonadaceae bacterium]
MKKKKPFVTARLHVSGHYFFCPYCSLSFRHPSQIESFYRIGYGWCWYCLRFIPIEGGDKKGIVRVDERGELYTEFYEAEDREREAQRVRRVEELCRPRRRGEDET